MTFPITKEEFKKWVKKNPSKVRRVVNAVLYSEVCPLAKALSEKTGQKWAVGTTEAVNKTEKKYVDLPMWAMRFVSILDGDGKVSIE